DPEPPGGEVPADRADQAAEDDDRGDRARFDDPFGDGRCDRERDEGAEEVEEGGDADGDLWRQRPGRDRRRHRVGGVVEAVGEVEADPGGDDQRDDDVSGGHGAYLSAPAPPECEKTVRVTRPAGGRLSGAPPG